MESLWRPQAQIGSDGSVLPRAEHVLDELEGRIALILNAGPTLVGVESTIVRVNEDKNKIEILRQGPVSEESLAEIAPTEEIFGVAQN